MTVPLESGSVDVKRTIDRTGTAYRDPKNQSKTGVWRDVLPNRRCGHVEFLAAAHKKAPSGRKLMLLCDSLFSDDIVKIGGTPPQKVRKFRLLMKAIGQPPDFRSDPVVGLEAGGFEVEPVELWEKRLSAPELREMLPHRVLIKSAPVMKNPQALDDVIGASGIAQKVAARLLALENRRRPEAGRVTGRR